jgi:hypothetical protein
VERTRVMGGECRCPGAPHPEDWVELESSVPIMVGVSVTQAIASAGDDEGRLTALMAQAYVRYGIRAWSFTNEAGNPLPVDPSDRDWPGTVDRLLPWDKGGAEVADAADGLYSEAVLRPLLGRTSKRSPGGQMDGSTSATPASGPTRRKRQRRSSQVTSAAGRPSVAPDQSAGGRPSSPSS